MGQFLSTITRSTSSPSSSSSSSSYEQYLSEYLKQVNENNQEQEKGQEEEPGSSGTTSNKNNKNKKKNNNNNSRKKTTAFVIERIVSEDAVDDVVPVMAKSFALGPCPMHDWAIGPEFSLLNTNTTTTTTTDKDNNSDENRVMFVEWSMRWVFYLCIKYGIVLVAKEQQNEDDTDTNNTNTNTKNTIRSVVCALPPETNYVADCTNWLQPHVIKLIFKMKGGPPDILGPDPIRRMDLMGEMMVLAHKHAVDYLTNENKNNTNTNANEEEEQSTPPPSPQQQQQQQLPWYIFVIATDPDEHHQGKGYATALLTAIHALADHDQVHTILETSGERNINFYCRPALGYTKIGGTTGGEVRSSDLPNADPNDAVVIAQSLVRRPQQRPVAASK